jgi:hypothetical protein
MRARDTGFLVGALALHLAIPALARVAPRYEPPMVARSSGAFRVEAIDVEVEPAPAEPPPEVREPPPEPAPEPAAEVAVGATRRSEETR